MCATVGFYARHLLLTCRQHLAPMALRKHHFPHLGTPWPPSPARYGRNWLKVRALGLTQYDAVLLVDSDVAVVSAGLDAIFSLPVEFAAVWDQSKWLNRCGGAGGCVTADPPMRAGGCWPPLARPLCDCRPCGACLVEQPQSSAACPLCKAP